MKSPSRGFSSGGIETCHFRLQVVDVVLSAEALEETERGLEVFDSESTVIVRRPDPPPGAEGLGNAEAVAEFLEDREGLVVGGKRIGQPVLPGMGLSGSQGGYGFPAAVAEFLEDREGLVVSGKCIVQPVLPGMGLSGSQG